MNSETVAGVLGAIIGAVVLIVAFVYGPSGKPDTQKIEAPKAQPTAPPAVRGPVIREVPQ
jgi:hypothetical protein